MGKEKAKKSENTENPKEEPQPKRPIKEIILDFYKNKLTSTFKLFIRMNTYKRKHWPLLFSGYVSMIACSVLETNHPHLVGEITDVIHSGKGIDGLWDVSTYLVLLLVSTSILEVASNFLLTRLNKKIERELREEYFNILLNKDITFFDETKTGEIGSKLTRDIGTIKTSVTSDFVTIIRKVISIVGSFFICLAISYKLAIILALLALPRSAMIFKYSGYIKQIRKDQHKEMNAANGIALESFMNIRVVKTFSTEDKESLKYCKKLDEYTKVEQEVATKSALYEMFKKVLHNVAHMTLIAYGGYLVVNSQLTIGQITRFVASSGRLVQGINSIETSVKGLFMSLANAEDIYDQIDSVKKIIDEKSSGLIKENLKGEIEFKDVTFSYPTSTDIKVYDKLSVKIEAGESVALVGASGSGKSTFVSLFLRLYDATEGEIHIDGQDIKSYNLKWLHSQIGYVSQEPSLFSGTLEENITYGVTTWSDQDIEEAITQASAKTFIKNKDSFPKGLETKIAERGLRLSGGQKQRIAIARALIKKPKILVFDEATSALDSQSESQVQSAIDSILKKGDKTMLIIAHRLSTVINCKRILVFKDGKIVEEGNHKSLLEANGVYSELVKTQLSAHHTEIPKPSNAMKIVKEKKKKKISSPNVESQDDQTEDSKFL